MLELSLAILSTAKVCTVRKEVGDLVLTIAWYE